MRFDDIFQTVLAAGTDTPLKAQSAWRQIVDLVGRGRVPADGRSMSVLAELAAKVPADVRSASARALFGASPPAELVALFGRDATAVAAPLLRGIELDAETWRAVLPALSPSGRAILRHRRDLPADTVRALESFGPVDFVLSSDTVAEPPAAEDGAAPEDELAADPAPMPMAGGPFVSVGAIARDILARARSQENDNEAVPPPAPRADGTFRIADVVARIEAFRRRRAESASDAATPRAIEGFEFETDALGAIRWVQGVERGAVIGMSLARPASLHAAGVDAAVAGAFARRGRFDRGRLVVAGGSDAAGDWTIVGVPTFEQASGRFAGYRGRARRPRAGERAGPVGTSPDALRQLVHELRTPTNAIAGFSEMIEQQMLGPVAAPYREQATTIRRDALRLIDAIDDLDTQARLTVGALSLATDEVDLRAMLRRVVTALKPLAASRRATLELDAGPAIAAVDGPMLERTLTRLIAAMAGAAAKGETIGVRLKPDDTSTWRIAVDRAAAFADHPGDAILELDDETTPASLLGTGFALRLVRNLADELGGSVTFGDRRLTLRVPAAVDRAMEKVRQN